MNFTCSNKYLLCGLSHINFKRIQKFLIFRCQFVTVPRIRRKDWHTHFATNQKCCLKHKFVKLRAELLLSLFLILYFTRLLQYETGHLIGHITISRPIRCFVTKQTSEINAHRPHPLIPFDLQVNKPHEPSDFNINRILCAWCQSIGN